MHTLLVPLSIVIPHAFHIVPTLLVYSYLAALRH